MGPQLDKWTDVLLFLCVVCFLLPNQVILERLRSFEKLEMK